MLSFAVIPQSVLPQLVSISSGLIISSWQLLIYHYRGFQWLILFPFYSRFITTVGNLYMKRHAEFRRSTLYHLIHWVPRVPKTSVRGLRNCFVFIKHLFSTLKPFYYRLFHDLMECSLPFPITLTKPTHSLPQLCDSFTKIKTCDPMSSVSTRRHFPFLSIICTAGHPSLEHDNHYSSTAY